MLQNVAGQTIVLPGPVCPPAPDSGAVFPSRADRRRGYWPNSLAVASDSAGKPLRHDLPLFSCPFPFYFVTLTSSKVLSLKKAQIYLAFYSLIRTFAATKVQNIFEI